MISLVKRVSCAIGGVVILAAILAIMIVFGILLQTRVDDIAQINASPCPQLCNGTDCAVCQRYGNNPGYCCPSNCQGALANCYFANDVWGKTQNSSHPR